MNPEMDMSETRVPLQGVVKIFEAGLKSKTWDIHRMPQFITTTHHEGCKTCDAYVLHIVKASEASMVEIIKVGALVTVSKRGMYVMFMCGTGSQFGYVIGLRE